MSCLEGGKNMVKERNSYLSGPQHLGAGIKVPRLRVDVRDLPRILEAEDFRQDEQFEPISCNTRGCWRLPDKMTAAAYDPATKERDDIPTKTISLAEVFARLEQFQKMELTKKNFFIDVTEWLCNTVGFAYDATTELFYHLSYSLKGCKNCKIVWQKEDAEKFSLKIFWGDLMEKEFKAKSLLGCFRKADYFISY